MEKHLDYTAVSSPTPPLNSERRKRNKKSKLQQASPPQDNASVEWKSDVQQQIYSSKLLRALRHVRQNSGNGSAAAPKRVREAADTVLAATAKGRSRWSRAILTNRLKLNFMKKKNNIVKRQRNVMTVITAGSGRARKSKVSVARLRAKGMPAFQRKARVLGRLVPGCRKQPLPVVLDEASDYIAALEMQVRAMSALAELLSGSSSLASTGSAQNQPGTSQTPPS